MAAKRIRAEHPGVGVVVLSQYVEEDYAFELLADGVAGMGYLLKERVSDVDELVRALQEVTRGGSALDPAVVEALLARRRPTTDPLRGLTDRERDVLQQMATGRNNATIATDPVHERPGGREAHRIGLPEARALSTNGKVNRRVMAVLAFLEASDHEHGEDPSHAGVRPPPPTPCGRRPVPATVRRRTLRAWAPAARSDGGTAADGNSWSSWWGSSASSVSSTSWWFSAAER